MSGIDAGDHEMEYDPVSDKINDMVHDYEHGEEFQSWLWQTIQDLKSHMIEIEDCVERATDDLSWTYPVDGDLNALRCAIETYLDKPVKRQA